MTTTITLFLAIAILLSYAIEIISKRIRIPSVLLLLIVGVLSRVLSDHTGLVAIDTLKYIPVIGTVGLILIVFEGGLELNYDAQKKSLIAKSFFTALANFILVTLTIGLFISWLSDSSLRSSLINAIPIAVVSSAIAIPAAQFLLGMKKEFVIYESVFSDIVGIVAFDYILKYETFKLSVLGNIALEMGAILLLCAAFCVGIIFIMKNSSHHLKYIMIITNLLLVYTLGKLLHLPTLIIALVLGLILKNFHLFKFKLVNKHLVYEEFENDLTALEEVTKEGVFVIKTFFFIMLGYMIDLSVVISFLNIGMVMLILLVIFVFRWITLNFSLGRRMGEVLYMAPRGLITVLLFVSIPTALRLPIMGLELLLLLILVNSLVIPFAFLKKQKTLDIS